jgi:GDPmannose 4,6-dehydratase
MDTKIALITGITGQDGSFLAEILLENGYKVHGIVRRSSSFNTERIDHIFDKITLHFGDLTDGLSIYSIIDKVRPREIYHLGAQSHVRVSFDIPVYTGDSTALGTTRILEAIKNIDPSIRFYNAASSEMFGKVQETPQKETTPFYPRSPYGCAKLYSYWLTRNYREGCGMYACSGILFNHESERRGDTFVTKKITNYVKLLKKHMYDSSTNVGKLQLGNLDARRDWGYAKDYMYAVWLMLQQDEPDDYVVATNETHSIHDFLKEAFGQIGIENYMDFIEINPKYYRPTEVDLLLGDYSKIKEKIGWQPAHTFKELVKIMIEN